MFVSRFAKLLPPELAGQYLEAAAQVISANDAGIPIKVSAVKAVHKYVAPVQIIIYRYTSERAEIYLSFCQSVDDDIVMPFVSRIAHDLGPFLAVTSEDTLSLVLETLSVVVEVNDASWMTEKLAESLVLAVLDVWTKHIKGERDDS